MSTPPTIATPTQLGGFEIIRRLGSGGMAEVFVAKKTGAEGIVKILVVKRILGTHHGRRFRTMFIEEAQLATRLNHPNIVQVYDFQDAGEEGLLLAMEYVEGTDLGQLAGKARARGTRIPPWVSAYIVAEAARGLHYAHERKDGDRPLEIVHRDVSPQNILLSYEGATKIADFGIASANLFREESGVIKGKYGYMSPEQACGERVDRRSDIYALGVILHELLTGRPLHGSLTGEALLQAVRSGIVEPPSTFARDVPPELEAIVMRALSKAREDRFQTARDLAGAILRAQLHRQELVDASAVEATILQLIGRELTSPGTSDAPPIRHSAAPVSPRSWPGQSLSSSPPLPSSPSSRPRRKSERVAREVRHVAIVALRLHGLDELELILGQQAAAMTAERIRTTLDDIAYKRGARFAWEGARVARAIVGLLSNPARAAADSAWLALDVHEALTTAYEDLEVPIRASIGIVRAIAKGERDPEGHLVRHKLESPADAIANLVGRRTEVGKTWATGGLYRLIRREFRWGDAPTLEVPADPQGQMPASMRLYALERALTREERLAERALLSSELVGREAEKADLHAAYHRAVRGKGQVTARVILGEMGIGKTALVSAFLSELPPDTKVVRVECSPSRAEIPFADIGELLRELVGTTADQPIDSIIERVEELLEPRIASQAPAMAISIAELITGKMLRDIEDDDAQYKKRLVYEGVRAIIASLVKSGPLVIVIDALQWSHRSGLELIARLLERKAPLPVLALFVTRPDERALPFLEGLLRIELSGLRSDEQMHLIETRLGVHDGVRELCSDLVAKVAGNPFFLLEMVDALLERGTFEIREGADGRQVLVRVLRATDGGDALPSTLEQLIGDRLRELPHDEHSIVEWLAVAGGPLAISDILSLSHFDSEKPIERLLGRGLCEERGDRVDFKHPLARDVAYMALDPTHRARMHRKLAEHLATTPVAKGLSAALVAAHFARGDAPLAAAELYLEAATTARSSLQSRQSIRFFQRALALLPEGDARRLVAHEALEAIYRVLGRKHSRKKHLEAMRALARKVSDPAWVTIALLRTARQSLDDGFLAAGLPYAEKAERVAKIAQSPKLEVEAQALSSELLRELGDIPGALKACERALSTASDPSVSARLRGEALRTRGVLLRRVGRVEEAVDCYAEAIAIFRKTRAKRQEARAKNSLSYAMFVLERYEDAIALALESIDIDLAIGGRFQLAKTISNIGYAYARLGDMPRALAYLSRARELHERYSDQDARADTLLVSAEVLIEEGDLDAAHVLCGDAAALIAVTKNAYDFVHERLVRALLSRAAFDHASAAACAFEARQAAEGRTLVSFTLFAMAIEASARVDSGAREAGARLALAALDAVEAMEGTEFGLEVRGLCTDALLRSGAKEAKQARKRASAHARRVAEMIRDPRLRQLFLARPAVSRLLYEDDFPGGKRGVDA